MKQQIKREFTCQSAIAPEIYQANVDILPDLEIDPYCKEVTGTPLYDVLGWPYIRFGRSVKPTLVGAGFRQENGDYWQVKVYGKSDNGGRSGSYYAPKGIGDRAYLPNVPAEFRKIIATKHGLKPPAQGTSFWEWLAVHSEIPLFVTEGGKKALSLLSEGHAAIALYGCTCGAKTKRDGVVTPLYLIQDLERFAPRRTIYIAFDQDTKPKAKKAVDAGINRLAIAFSKLKAQVKILQWNSKLGKGVDDLIAKTPEAFVQSLNGATSYCCWKTVATTNINKYLSLKINQPYLNQEIRPPESAQIIGLRSPKGTRKTEWIAQIVAEAQSHGQQVINLTHRIKLGQELSGRLGIGYRGEKDPTLNVFGQTLCFDSLHPEAGFDPENWSGAWLILDEVEQGIWHMLNSPTCRQYRVSILKSFFKLIQHILDTDGKVFLADADLSNIAIDYIRELASDNPSIWLLDNEYKRPERDLMNYSSELELFGELVRAIANKQRVIVHTGAQKVKSLWSTQNLENRLKQLLPQLKILRIDSESTKDPNHPAFGCMANLNERLEGFDVVICSPVVETGVSITKSKFDSVWAIASGVQTVDAFCQTLERVRSSVPRHIFVRPTGIQYVGSGELSPQALFTSSHKFARAAINLLKQAGCGGYDELDFEFQAAHLNAWARRGAIVNLGMLHYRELILEKLAASSYRIQAYQPENNTPPIEPDLDKFLQNKQEVERWLQEQRDRAYQSNCSKIAHVEIKDPEEVRSRLESKNSRTEVERLQEQKLKLQSRYATEEVSPELVEQDAQRGWYRGIRLHYFLTKGKDYLIQNDSNTLKSRIDKELQLFNPDLDLYSIQVEALIRLGILDLLEQNTDWNNASLQEWFETKILPYQKDAKLYLNVSVQPNLTPIQALSKLLAKLAIKLEAVKKKGPRGKQNRIYRLAPLQDSREQIFARWLDLDMNISAVAA